MKIPRSNEVITFTNFIHRSFRIRCDWSKETKDLSPIQLSAPAMVTAWICIGGIFWLGLFPNTILNLANQAALIAAK
jgi:hypothetical protein